MGKVTGFLEYTRETAGAAAGRRARQRLVRDLSGRFPQKRSSTQGARCMDCGVPFCHTGCPLNNIIPDWNDLVYRDRWRDAIRVLHSTNNFPEFTGRICPAPCEAACVLGINEPPVTIKVIEQDDHRSRVRAKAGSIPSRRPTRTGKRVAVVGSGPAGLAAAQQLARAGHCGHGVREEPTASAGCCATAFPISRWRSAVIDRRMEQMAAEGVEFVTNAHVGVNIAVERTAARFRRRRAGRRRRAAARSEGSGPRTEGHPFRDGFSAAAEPARARATG